MDPLNHRMDKSTCKVRKLQSSAERKQDGWVPLRYGHVKEENENRILIKKKKLRILIFLQLVCLSSSAEHHVHIHYSSGSCSPLWSRITASLPMQELTTLEEPLGWQCHSEKETVPVMCIHLHYSILQVHLPQTVVALEHEIWFSSLKKNLFYHLF